MGVTVNRWEIRAREERLCEKALWILLLSPEKWPPEQG